MKKEKFSTKALKTLFKKQNIATMDELKQALGTTVQMTVFRKLKELSCRTSYSHRGKYYTLNEIARFNDIGLWSYRFVWFSKHGNLLETAKVFVNNSEAGYSASELENVLHVDVKEALLHLIRKDSIYREKVSGIYIYFSVHPAIRKQQALFRQDKASIPESIEIDVLSHELKAALILFFSLLDEKQRRLYAGLESIKIGHGGDRKIADFLGLDPHTVAKGRKELFSQDFELETVRKKGGGRKPVEKKFPMS